MGAVLDNMGAGLQASMAYNETCESLLLSAAFIYAIRRALEKDHARHFCCLLQRWFKLLV
jgi:hypothetical protein